MEKIEIDDILRSSHVYHLSKINIEDNDKKLHIFQMGNNPASNKYVNNKIKKCKDFNISAFYYKYADSDSESYDYMISLINKLKSDSNNKIMVQLPLPDNKELKSDILDYLSDVDGLGEDSQNILYTDKAKYFIKNNIFFNIPATARGCYYLAECLQQKYLFTYLYDEDRITDLRDHTVLIIGRSNLIGRPLARLLDLSNVTVLQAHSHTSKEDLLKMIDIADIIVTAVGKHGIIDSSMISGKTRKVIIDVGINFNEDGKMCGDFKPLEEDKDKPIFYTPVPGGVGRFTVEFLMYNVLEIPIEMY